LLVVGSANKQEEKEETKGWFSSKKNYDAKKDNNGWSS
jgi:hypothetical protein